MLDLIILRKKIFGKTFQQEFRKCRDSNLRQLSAVSPHPLSAAGYSKYGRCSCTHGRPVASEPGGAGLLEAALDVVGDGLVGAIPAVDLPSVNVAPVGPLSDPVSAGLVALKRKMGSINY